MAASVGDTLIRGSGWTLSTTGGTVVPADDELMTTDVAPKRIGLRVGYGIVAAMRKADQPSISIPIGIAL